jgi:OPT family oligopeptide transporter
MRAADDWLWALDFSPGFFGQGIITGLAIPLHMSTGTIVGWAILAPLAKRKGWAPGPVNDWESGGRAWIMWISLSGLMADAAVNLIWLGLGPVWSLLWRPAVREGYTDLQQTLPDSTAPFVSDAYGSRSESSNAEAPLLRAPAQPIWKSIADTSTSSLLGTGFLISTIICVVAVLVIFPSIFQWYYVFLAILLSLPMAVVGIRALGEADWNPNISLISQLVFAALIPLPNPTALVANLLSAALATAGANQAGDIAYDFKIGQLVGASPDAQILGHIIGSVFGAFVSCVIYRLYTFSYPIPGKLFGIPKAYVSINIAKLVLGQGLPDGAMPFVIAFGSVFLVFSVLKIAFRDRWWQILIPSGTSFAIGT